MDKYEKRRTALQILVDGLGRGGIAKIAGRINKEASYVSRMLYPPDKAGFKRIGEDTVDLLNAAFPGWLEYDGNTEPGPDIRGKVPLISWVQAGAFCNAVDLFEPGVADDWIPAVQALGPHAYALRVVGDSMTAPHGLSYPEGIIIFVDPDYPVTNGCRVIAKLPHAEEATFKVYSEDAGQKFLKPLNPQYPTIPITPDMRLCGVVRGAYRPE